MQGVHMPDLDNAESNKERDLSNAMPIMVGMVQVNQGIKGLDLIFKFTELAFNMKWHSDNPPNAQDVLDQCVATTRLIEVNFILASSPFRERSLFFTADTQVKVTGAPTYIGVH